MQPITLCAYGDDTEPVLDARNEYQRVALGVSDPDLSCPSWEAEMLEGAVPSSQAPADRLIAAGCTGLLVRSFAAPTGADELNRVLWKWGVSRLHASLIWLLAGYHENSRFSTPLGLG